MMPCGKQELSRDLAQAWARALQVADSLDALVRGYRALDPGHPHAFQIGFASLYLNTTRAWLRHLPQVPDPLFAYHVIPEFFALYRERVVERLDAPLQRIAPHWRAYHRQARRMVHDATPLAQLWLVTLGARAHTHHDLGEAILRVERQTGRALSGEWQTMFGPLASRAFSDAARGYFSTQDWARPVAALHPVWVPVLHHWRASGYRRAHAVLSPVDAQG